MEMTSIVCYNKKHLRQEEANPALIKEMYI